MKTQVFIPIEPALPSSELKSLLIDRFGGFTVVLAHAVHTESTLSKIRS